MLSVPAPAKVNLFLHVGARRADGYHTLQSLVCFAEAGDVLTFTLASTLSLSLGGPFARDLAGEDGNLILRAARALAARADVKTGAAIALTKNLPVASGIGGGSADAAAALRGLVKLWDLQIPGAEMHAIALSLGSDVPVCLRSAPATMEGRGELVSPVAELPPCAMLLVNPGVSVSTAEVFRRLDRTGSDVLPVVPPFPAAARGLDDLLRYLANTRNDMEAAARAIAPVVDEVLEELAQRGAALARMCGSGATCYGLFETDIAAAAAAQALSMAHPDWWTMLTRIARANIAAG